MLSLDAGINISEDSTILCGGGDGNVIDLGQMTSRPQWCSGSSEFLAKGIH
jgi:hypothetical protein